MKFIIKSKTTNIVDEPLKIQMFNYYSGELLISYESKGKKVKVIELERGQYVLQIDKERCYFNLERPSSEIHYKQEESSCCLISLLILSLAVLPLLLITLPLFIYYLLRFTGFKSRDVKINYFKRGEFAAIQGSWKSMENIVNNLDFSVRPKRFENAKRIPAMTFTSKDIDIEVTEVMISKEGEIILYNKISKKDLFSASIDSIIDCEIREFDKSSTNVSLSDAFIGGLLFGTAGTIIGGQQITTNKVDGLSLVFKLNDFENPFYEIKFIDEVINVTTNEYIDAKKRIFDVVDLIKQFKHNESNNTYDVETELHNIEKLKKYKELLDIGAIEASEFEEKKKHLLK